MSFTCPRCHYSTKKRCNIRDHLNRKTPCTPVHSDEEVNMLYMDFSYEKSVCVCEFCGKGFASQKYLDMHIKSCVPAMSARVDALATQLNSMQHGCTNNNLIQSVQSNNIQIQNNIINNNNITINLNSFGSEDRSYLKQELVKECYENLQIIPLIKDVYFNSDHPENHTIKLKSEKKKRVMVHEGNKKWNEYDMNTSIDTMMQIEHTKIIKHFYEVIWPDPTIDFEKKAFAQAEIVKLNDKNLRFFELRRNVQALLKSFEQRKDI